MKKVIKTIKRKSDWYLWQRDHYGDNQYTYTKCIDNNLIEVQPTASTWWDTKQAAWENRPREVGR